MQSRILCHLTPAPRELNCVSLIRRCKRGRPQEQYIVIYADRQRGEALRKIGNWASNPDLSLDWDDASAMSRQSRKDAAMPSESSQGLVGCPLATIRLTANSTIQKTHGTRKALLARLLRGITQKVTKSKEK